MDCPCGKFGEFQLSAVLVLSCEQINTQTNTHAAERLTSATVIGVNFLFITSTNCWKDCVIRAV